MTLAWMPLASCVCFSIPLDTVRSAIARINKKHEATSTGVSMGVGGMRVRIDAKLRQTLKLVQQYGMELLEIRRGGPADRAELKRLDVIISAANESIMEPRDLQRVVRRHKAVEK